MKTDEQQAVVPVMAPAVPAPPTSQAPSRLLAALASVARRLTILPTSLAAHPALVLTVLCTSAFAVAYALQAILRHASLGTSALDLGYEDQVLWNTLHGRPFQFSLLQGGGFSLDFQAPLGQAGTNLLGYHAELLLAPVSLLYAILPDVRALLAFQALVVCAGALPAYALARRRLGSDWAACAIAIAYLSSPFLEAELLSDFHSVALASSLLLFLFYAVERRWLVPALILGLLVAAAKEDAPAVVALVGLWAYLTRTQRLAGLLLTLIGIAIGLLDFGWLIPHFSTAGASPFVTRYGYLGSSPAGIVLGLLRRPWLALPKLISPEAVSYVAAILGSTAGLALFAPLSLAIAAPSLAINLLSTFPWMRSGMAHYSALVLPILMIASIEGMRHLMWISGRLLKRLRGEGPRAVTLALATLLMLSALVTHYQLGAGPGGGAFDPAPADSHDRLLAHFLAEVPPDAAVSASNSLIPHLSHRANLYLFPNVLDAQYVLLDLTTSPFPISWGDQRKRLLDLLANGQFGVQDAADGYVLLRRGASAPNLPPDTFSFADGPATDADATPLATFDGSITLVAAHATTERLIGAGWQETLTLDWQADQPVVGDAVLSAWAEGTPRPLPPDFDGEVPTLVWLPTSNWQPGRVIRTVLPPVLVQQPGAMQVGWYYNKAGGGVTWLRCIEASGASCPLASHHVLAAASLGGRLLEPGPWRWLSGAATMVGEVRHAATFRLGW